MSSPFSLLKAAAGHLVDLQTKLTELQSLLRAESDWTARCSAGTKAG